MTRSYYDSFYREYCLIDLSRYKDGKFGLRWRMESEVLSGKGDYICAELACFDAKKLRSWEVNFRYVEQGTAKNALVQVRLCEKCSIKLNYKKQMKEIQDVQTEEKGAQGTSKKRQRDAHRSPTKSREALPTKSNDNESVK